MTPLERAIQAVGGVSALAGAINSTASAPSMWKARESVPTDQCPAIERATKGGVTCEELRPDATWRRVRDRSWPWHPQGKPLLDVLPAEQGQTSTEGA